MKQNGYRGLSWSLLRIFLKQILDSLSVLTSAKVRQDNRSSDEARAMGTGMAGNEHVN